MSNAPGSWSQAPNVKLTTATVPGTIALMAIVPKGRDLRSVSWSVLPAT